MKIANEDYVKSEKVVVIEVYDVKIIKWLIVFDI